MEILSNLRIATRVRGAFGIMALMVLSVGATFHYCQWSALSGVERFYRSNTCSASALGLEAAQFQRLRNELNSAVNSDSGSAPLLARSTVAMLSLELAERLSLLERQLPPGEARFEHMRLMVEMDRYRAAADRVVARATERDVAQAQAELRGAERIAMEVDGHLARISELNDQDARDRLLLLRHSSQVAVLLGWTIVLLAALCAVVFTRLLNYNFYRPINAMSSMLQTATKRKSVR